MSIYFVIDAVDNLTSYNEKADASESFTSAKSAVARANDLALQSPGVTFYVAKAISKVSCAINPPTVEHTGEKG